MEKNHGSNKRRGRVFDRRQKTCRRLRQERRADLRNLLTGKRGVSWKNRMRVLLNPRLGVDRRQAEQRVPDDRRGVTLASLLTKEELAALLAE